MPAKGSAPVRPPGRRDQEQLSPTKSPQTIGALTRPDPRLSGVGVVKLAAARSVILRAVRRLGGLRPSKAIAALWGFGRNTCNGLWLGR